MKGLLNQSSLKVLVVLLFVTILLPNPAVANNKSVYKLKRNAISDKFCGIWEYQRDGSKNYFKVIKVSNGKFRFTPGYEYEGKIVWQSPMLKKADGIYLQLSNGMLKGKFVSANFYATHGQDFTYKITLDIKSDKKLLYSVHSSIRGVTDSSEATKISDKN